VDLAVEVTPVGKELLAMSSRTACLALFASLALLLISGLAVPARAANNASFYTQSVPTAMVTGETRSVAITLQNTGTTSWTEAAHYRLGTQNPQDNTLWTGASRVLLGAGESIFAGSFKTFTFNITAPATPGTYNFQWRMVQEGVEWFGAFTPNVAISVTAPPAYGAQFVSLSAPSSLVAGQTASASVTMRNTGTNVWTAAAGYKLGSQNPQDNTTWGTGRVNLGAGDSIGFNATKTFTFNITAPATPGTYNFQWQMLQEGVIWFGAFSPNSPIQVVPAPVTLCPGVTVTPDGTSDASPAIQSCINATASGGTLNLPAGTYGMGGRILITKPMTLRTQGLAGSPANCEAPGISCAVLKALPSFNSPVSGFLAVENTTDVTIDHLVLDGNRAARLGTSAASGCSSGTNVWGYNSHMANCVFCRFTNSVSKNALCGTGLEFSGNDATFTNNVFRGNGQNSANNMWSDGLTLHFSDRATVSNNTFVDNSDVSLVLGGCRNAFVSNNSFSQPGQVVFAALMLNVFSSGAPRDYTGTVVTGNTIDCSAARNCHFGIQLGAHPWDPSLPTILGGDVHGNSVTSARQGIDVDGAGTAASPLVLYGNTSTNSSTGSASFQCGSHSTSNLNINTGDSVVNRNGDTAPITTFAWHGCV
jgi:parallel beta-helix repeat protein